LKKIKIRFFSLQFGRKEILRIILSLIQPCLIRLGIKKPPNAGMFLGMKRPPLNPWPSVSAP